MPICIACTYIMIHVHYVSWWLSLYPFHQPFPLFSSTQTKSLTNFEPGEQNNILYSKSQLLLLYSPKITLAMAIEDYLPWPGYEVPDMPSVALDVMGLDSHQFRINYDVPEEITRQLEELYVWNDSVTKIPNRKIMKLYTSIFIQLIQHDTYRQINL